MMLYGETEVHANRGGGGDIDVLTVTLQRGCALIGKIITSISNTSIW
jgi:hypothetical protein